MCLIYCNGNSVFENFCPDRAVLIIFLLGSGDKFPGMQFGRKSLLSEVAADKDAYAGGRRGSCPLCRHSWGAGGARIALHTELFPSLLSAEEAFFSIVDSFVQGNFSGGTPPDPQIIIVLLRDQCTKHCSSGKEFKDQNLSL